MPRTRISGPALRRILHREHKIFAKREYEAVVTDLGVAALQPAPERYLPQATGAPAAHPEPQTPIGERRKPDPRGKPGYLRIDVDTVHQGNHDGKAGEYHINAVDTVTQ